MKKIIAGLVLAGLLLTPASFVRAQVEPTDREAILAQLNLIYAQLVQLLSQLQTQLQADLTAQSAEIQNINQSQADVKTKLDKVVENTTPATSTVPEPAPVTPVTPVVKELVVRAVNDTVVLGKDSARIIVEVLHDGSPAANIPFTITTNDEDERGWNRLFFSRPYSTNKYNFKVVKNGTEITHKGPASLVGYEFSKVGTFTFAIEAEGMTETVQITVTE